MYLGLTGNIGSGKSAAAMFFEKHGCYCLEADEISRIVMRPDGQAFGGIVDAFGEGVLAEDGTLNRRAIRDIVFSDPDKRKLLESIVWPAMAEYERKAVGRIKGRDDKAVIIMSSAIAIEAGNYERFDGLIVVYADPKVQLERVMKRDNISAEDAKKIIAAQMPIEKKLEYADYIINNSEGIDRLEREVRRVFDLIKMLKYCDGKS